MTEEVSRRAVLAGGAAAVGASLAVTLAPTVAEAQPMLDVPTLNALLGAEYAAIRAYEAGAAILRSPPPGDPQASVAPAALTVATRFQSQHRDHARALASLVTAANGTPVRETTEPFAPPAGFRPSVLNVLRLACNAEKAAAIAYAGALEAVGSQSAAALVAAIGGVETQHFIVLYLLAHDVVTPGPMAAAGDLVPQSFVSRVGAGTTGLQDVPDFAYFAS